MQIGDLVKSSHDYPYHRGRKGLIVRTNINMWNEETTPSGVLILWSDCEIETVYEDEIEVINDCRDS